MRNIVFIVIAFVLSFSGRVCAGNPVYSDNSLRNDAEKLLVEWVDALLTYQWAASVARRRYSVSRLCPHSRTDRRHGSSSDVSGRQNRQ